MSNDRALPRNLVFDAVLSRRAVRAYTDEVPSKTVIADVLSTASRSPSAGNIQPWFVAGLSGAPLQSLIEDVQSHIRAKNETASEFAIYPLNLSEPFRGRRYRNGEQLYQAVGAPRDQQEVRLKWMNRNYSFFEAPVGLFFYIDRQFGRSQWADLGMYVQTVMLLLESLGISSCPQTAWATQHKVVDAHTKVPENLMLFCGMAVGIKDASAAINSFISERVPREELMELHGWE